jgi:hypothetical protein
MCIARKSTSGISRYKSQSPRIIKVDTTTLEDNTIEMEISTPKLVLVGASNTIDVKMEPFIDINTDLDEEDQASHHQFNPGDDDDYFGVVISSSDDDKNNILVHNDDYYLPSASSNSPSESDSDLSSFDDEEEENNVKQDGKPGETNKTKSIRKKVHRWVRFKPLRLSPPESVKELNPLIKLDNISTEELNKMNIFIPPKRKINYRGPRPCSECDQVFTTRAELQNHKKIHPRRKPGKKRQSNEYKCTDCPRTFNFKSVC